MTPTCIVCGQPTRHQVYAHCDACRERLYRLKDYDWLDEIAQLDELEEHAGVPRGEGLERR